MKLLEQKEGLFRSWQIADNEILLVRTLGVERSELAKADELLLNGRWIALELEEVGDTLIEHYKRIGD